MHIINIHPLSHANTSLICVKESEWNLYDTYLHKTGCIMCKFTDCRILFNSLHPQYPKIDLHQPLHRISFDHESININDEKTVIMHQWKP